MMEEGNKEEALECLAMARIAVQQGDRARALKFITKARRLDPSLPSPDYLLSSLKPYNPISQNSPPSSPPPNIRHRVRSTFTEQEQISIVSQIRKHNNYYAILGLDRSCSDEDVRKAYRKLSLKVHPDKNNAPGAEEAFKSVSKAFQCLSDEKSRKTYDVSGFASGSESGPGFECDSEKTESQSGFECGSEKTQTSSAQSTWCRYEKPGGHGYNVYNGFFENEFDPEKIFRNFFGMSQPLTPTTTTQFGGYTFRTAHTSRRTNGVQMGEEREDDRSGNLDSPFLFLLLAVVIVTLVTIMTVSVPIYKLSNDYPYTIQFTTAKGVEYYVRMADYEKQYPENSPQRVKLESKIESEYFSSLRKSCWAESKRRWWGITSETPNCDRLNHLQAQT